jgi:hypothetical protein
MKFRLPTDLATILLAVWLILFGLMGLGLTFPYSGYVVAALAIATGVLLLLRR